MKLESKISKYFTWQEVLWLPRWRRVATEEDGFNEKVKANLIELCQRLDEVRSFFKKPMIVHSGFRPRIYNAEIPGAAKNSLHISGMAMDFHVNGVPCDAARKRILEAGLLEKLTLRMENLPGSGWVHLDTKSTGIRFFKP